jgi:amino acid adenylation domain-containing protein
MNHITTAEDLALETLNSHCESESNSKLGELDSGNLPVYLHVERYAGLNPDAVAALTGGKQITYGELNSQANQLAHYLISQQVKAQDCVGVLVEPGWEILMAILAIHKINGIYLPIDPEFPFARIENIVEQAQPKLILCASQRWTEIESGLTRLNTQIINLPQLNLEEFKSDNPNYDCPLDNISHIFFTSGTTGTPKGVVSTHRNLIHYIFSASEQYRFGAEDSFLAATRFTFSISLLMLLLPLVSGGQVNIITQEELLDPQLLAQAIEKSTFFHLGPSVLKMLLDFLDEQPEALLQTIKRFAHVKHASSGGDMIPHKILNRLNCLFAQAEVFAIYGSSEISCMGCTFLVPKDLELKQTLVGKPFSNVQLRVLNAEQKVVPYGVKGEIYFAGFGITRGYLNLPELTSEKYVLLDGQRFYRTGDLGLLTREGNLQVLGREDFQVQIRGIRIELAEIEFNLNLHPAIVNSVVVATEDHQGEKQLVAYLIAAMTQPPTAMELRSFLADVLPAYMLPSRLVFLERFPLTLNGKVDRLSLPEPAFESLTENFIAPRNQLEQQLVEIWQEILNLETLSVQDNFFELGGHSLLIATLSAKLEKIFAIKLPLAVLFQMPTIEKQASFFEQKGSSKSWSSLAPIQPKGSKPPLFLFQGVGIYYPLSSYLGEDQPVYGLSIEMIDDSTHWFEQIEDLASLYIQEIKTVQPHGPYYFGGLSFGGMVALEVAQQLQAQGEKVALLAMLDTWGSKTANVLEPIDKKLLIYLRKFYKSGFKYLFARFNRLRSKFRKTINKTRQLNKVTETYLKARESYIPQMYLGKITLFKSMETERMVESGNFDAQLGWGNYAAGGLETINVPGDHLGILKEPNVAILAQELKTCINKCSHDYSHHLEQQYFQLITNNPSLKIEV